jgi:hypothetical protein
MFENLKKITDEIVKGLEKAKDEAIDNNLATMADANVSRIEQGLNAEGQLLGRYKNPEYAQFKKAIGSIAPLGVFDFKLEGDFLSGVFAKKNNKNIEFGSKDSKTKKLEALAKDWGGDLFGLLDDQRKDIYEGQIIPEIIDWINTKLQKI